MSLPLLQTKLYAPPLHSNLVHRPRLLARWQAEMPPPLTLISAPAGFGKTTLISEWIDAVGQARRGKTDEPQAASRQLSFCWLSLDQEDNDPIRFLTYLVSALQSCQPAIGEGALGLLAAPQAPPLQAILTQLINELSKLETTICLVLDDYHFINTPAIHEALNFLIDHLPTTLRVIMTTRADPPLHLSRWRVRRQLLEVRADDLRFTAAESALFLKQVMGLHLSADEIEALETRTEGWIAGLQLVALSIQGRGDGADVLKHVSGNHRFIFDYLVDEVLSHQPPGIERFLLQSSILERMSASLCAAVTEESQPQAILEALERDNLFVIVLDDERRWYRYHHLFGEVLRSRLQNKMAETVPTLHLRASRWYAKQNAPHQAVAHGFASNDWEHVATVIEQMADAMLEYGESALLQSWLGRLPAEIKGTHPRLSLAQAWVFHQVHQIEAVEAQLQVAEAGIDRFSSNEEAMAFRGELSALRVAIALYQRDLPTTILLAQQSLTELPANKTRLRAQTTMRLGLAYNWSGDLAQAAHSYAEAARLGQVAGDIRTAVLATTNQAGILYERGQLRQSATLEQAAIDIATAMGSPQISIVGTVQQTLAQIYMEWNQLDRAAALLQSALERIQPTGNPRFMVEIYSSFSRLFAAQGDLTNALAQLRLAEQLVQEHDLPIRYAAPVLELRIQWWLAHDQVDEASQWATQSGLAYDDTVSVGQDGSYRTLARVLLAQGEFTHALHLLEHLQHFAATLGRRVNEIQAWVLCIVTLAHHNQRESALQRLHNLLKVTEPEGYIRLFVDEGELMRSLLYELRFTVVDSWLRNYIDRLLAAFDLQPLPHSIETNLHSAPIQNPKSKIQNLIEPLTAREIEVLHLVAEGLSDRQIAATLVVALGTVKRHLNNLYGKLGVQRRTQAILRAKEVGLL